MYPSIFKEPIYSVAQNKTIESFHVKFSKAAYHPFDKRCFTMQEAEQYLAEATATLKQANEIANKYIR